MIATLVFRDLRVPGSARAGLVVGIALAATAAAFTIAGAATTATSNRAEPRADASRHPDEDLSVVGMFGEAPAAAPKDTPAAEAHRGGEDAHDRPGHGPRRPRQGHGHPGRAPAPAARRGLGHAVRARLLRGSQRPALRRGVGAALPAVRANLGPYARWKAGYGTTLSSTPQDFAVDGTTVTHTLVARDRGCARAAPVPRDVAARARRRRWTACGLAATAAGPQSC